MKIKTIKFETGCTKYNLFSFLKEKFNRPVDESSVKKLENSMQSKGFLGALIIIQTRSFGGKLQHFIADGQHRFTAASRLKIAYNYQLIELVGKDDTAENVTKLIADLNSTSRGWSNQNYLDCWVANGVREYKVFQKHLKETKLKFTDLFHIFLGGGGTSETKQFKGGSMKFDNEKRSEDLLKSVVKMSEVLPNKAYSRRALYRIIQEVGDYKKLEKLIVNSKIKFTENEEQLENEIRSLYYNKRGNLKIAA